MSDSNIGDRVGEPVFHTYEERLLEKQAFDLFLIGSMFNCILSHSGSDFFFILASLVASRRIAVILCVWLKEAHAK